MRLYLLAAAALASAASAQTAPEVSYATSAEIKQLIAKAKATIKPGEPVLVQPLLQFAPYKAVLEYRQGATGAAVHRVEAEYFTVLEGGGDLVQGGTLVGQTAPDERNFMGTAIAGGTKRHVAAGDVLVIPENTPHWFNRVDGRLVMISLKVPRTGANR